MPGPTTSQVKAKGKAKKSKAKTPKIKRGKFTPSDTYLEQEAQATEAGFVDGVILRHYKDPTNAYTIKGFVNVQDNSEYNGELGVVYEDMATRRLFVRPFRQMNEAIVYGTYNGPRFAPELVIARLPAHIWRRFCEAVDHNIRVGDIRDGSDLQGAISQVETQNKLSHRPRATRGQRSA